MQKTKLSKLVSIGLLSFAIAAGVATSATAKNTSLYANNDIQLVNQISTLGLEDASEIDGLKCEIQAANYTENSCLLKLNFTAESGNSFYLGYGENEQNAIPGAITLSIKRSDKKVEERTFSITRKNKNGFSDNLGEIGSASTNLTVNIPLAIGETLDLDSTVTVKNIVRATKNKDGKFEPARNEDGSFKFQSLEASKKSNFKIINSNDLLDVRFLGYSTFGNDVDFSFMAKGNPDAKIYKRFGKTAVYNQNKKDIEEGNAWIRVRLSFSNESRIKLLMNDDSIKYLATGSKEIDITNKETRIGTLFNNVDYKNIKNIWLENFNVTYDIFSNKMGKSVPKSNIVQPFYSVDMNVADVVNSTGTVIKPSIKDDVYDVDSTLIVTLSVLGIAVIYGLVAGTLYFYLKKKNANDEFKRMNTKSYVKTNVMGLLTIEFLTLMIESIVLRSTLILTSFNVGNNMDILIVTFSVASIIFVGYFIKYFFTQIKNLRERKKMDEINNDKLSGLDDGTLIIPKNKQENN